MFGRCAPPINGALLFWTAFVLTRSLGATVGDFLSKPVDRGGLNWGTTWTSATLLQAVSSCSCKLDWPR